VTAEVHQRSPPGLLSFHEPVARMARFWIEALERVDLGYDRGSDLPLGP
jgi:hypothetical protein